MYLFLMQHGSCLSKKLDPEQPLSPVGREQIEKSASAARSLGLAFDLIIASTKKRSVQTAMIMAKHLDYPDELIVSSNLFKPTANPASALEFMAEQDGESFLVTGHLPSLNNISSQLLNRDQKLKILFENGGLTCIHVESFTKGRSTLFWHLPPTMLAAMA